MKNFKQQETNKVSHSDLEIFNEMEKGGIGNPYSFTEFESLTLNGNWQGGFVENVGYTEPSQEGDHLGYTNTSYFYGWYENANCFELCKKILRCYTHDDNYGYRGNAYNLTQYSASGNQLVNCSGNDSTYFYNALACIDAHLRAGRPVIVGVYVNGRAPYWANPDGCQHFVVITEKTSNGYRFVDCGSKYVKKGCSTQNIFTVDWTNRRINGYTAASTNYHNIVITHIRPNM